VNESKIRTWPLLLSFTLVRFIASTAFRLVFPFLPFLARGMGVSVEQLAAAISARSALGLFGPLLGSVADVKGRKQTLLIALLVCSLSMFIVGFWPTYPAFLVGVVISGGAIVVIDSSIHAYIGDQIPFARRGRAAALVELGWSLAFVIGIPLVGLSMTRSGWNAPFIWLGVSCILAIGLINWIVPATQTGSSSWQDLRFGLSKIISIVPLFGLLMAFLLTLANQVISIVFGIWMENSFHLQIDQLGAASSVIGLAGAVGVGCALLFTDRLGKRHSIGLGLILNSTACLSLPLLGKHLGGTLAILFIFYLSFEFTLTSLLPLMTTLSTHARGVFMAATLAAFSLGDSIGALIGPRLIEKDLMGNILVSSAINLCSLFILIVILREEKTPEAAG